MVDVQGGEKYTNMSPGWAAGPRRAEGSLAAQGVLPRGRGDSPLVLQQAAAFGESFTRQRAKKRYPPPPSLHGRERRKVRTEKRQRRVLQSARVS